MIGFGCSWVVGLIPQNRSDPSEPLGESSVERDLAIGSHPAAGDAGLPQKASGRLQLP